MTCTLTITYPRQEVPDLAKQDYSRIRREWAITKKEGKNKDQLRLNEKLPQCALSL